MLGSESLTLGRAKLFRFGPRGMCRGNIWRWLLGHDRGASGRTGRWVGELGWPRRRRVDGWGSAQPRV